MFIKMIRNIICLFFLSAGFAALAQNARFTGQVTDSQNAVIPGAEIQIVNKDTLVKLEAQTDATGNYTVPYLAAGHYRIEVRAPGFAASVKNDVALGMGQAFIFNVQLSVGGEQSTVTVEGGASAAAQINTENAEVNDTITGKEVEAIQLNGRNFTQLIALAPGVSNQTQQDEARVGLRGSVSYSVNGGRTEYNSFQIDGSETMNAGVNKDHTSLVVTPSVDAIQEIKVLTSNYGAQYPSTGNGTTIVTTKSGTDSYHGNLFEFVRNEMFNAKGYFDVTNGAPRYRRSDFGGTIGGPLSIPHLYNGRGKTHFFFSEEARIETDPYPYRQAVPSPEERNGDFTDLCPVNGSYADCPSNASNYAGAGYKIGVSSTATALLNSGAIPLANSYGGCTSTTGYCYLTETYLPTYYREELFRIDHTFSEKTQASFRYIHDEWSTTTNTPQYGYETNSFPTIQNRLYGPGISLSGRITHTFSSTLLNEFVASYVDQLVTLKDTPANGVSLERPSKLLDDTATCAVTPGSPNSVSGLYNSPVDQNVGKDCGMGHIFATGGKGTDGVAKMPGIVIGGNNAAYGGTGFSVDTSYMPWEHTAPTYSFSDNVTKVWRMHNFQFGGQWLIFQRNQTNGPIGAATGDVQGLITFSNQQSSYTTGNAFADFLGMGAIASYQQDSAQGRYYQRYQIFEPYFQDDWKMTSRLTVNLGLRVSAFGTYHEKNGKAYNWVPTAYSRAVAESVKVSAASGELLSVATGNPVPIYQKDGSVTPSLLNGIVQCGKNGVPDGCMKGHLWNFAPRVGFAWDPLGSGKMSIRAGYGIFFEHGTADEANTGSLEASGAPVLSMTQLTPYGQGCIGNTDPTCPYNSAGAFPLNITSIPTKAVWPYVQQWSMSIERALPKQMLASFAYVGGKGTHLTLEREINQLIPTPTATNPFGQHEPLDTSSCEMGQGINNTKAEYDFHGQYHLLSGAVVGPTDPGYLGLRVACYGKGLGGLVDPNSLREYAPGMGQIYSLENIANSHYNAFQALLRRTAGPLMLGVAYTYSHSLDNASDRSDTTSVNAFDLASNRASSNFDQRHMLHVSYIYDLPLRRILQSVFANLNSDPNSDNRADNRPAMSYLTSKAMRSLLDGWQLSGLTLFETGIPFTVVNNGGSYTYCLSNDCSNNTKHYISALDNAGVYNGVGSGSYPDLVGSPHAHHASKTGDSVGPLLLNPGAFAAPRGLTFGNAGRNVLNNPNRWNFDMAMQRSFGLHFLRLGDSSALLFRAEAFNVFNHTQFRIYNPTLGNQANNTISCYANSATSGYSAAGDSSTDCQTGSSFLHPVDAHRPRTIQFGLKLAF